MSEELITCKLCSGVGSIGSDKIMTSCPDCFGRGKIHPEGPEHVRRRKQLGEILGAAVSKTIGVSGCTCGPYWSIVPPPPCPVCISPEGDGTTEIRLPDFVGYDMPVFSEEEDEVLPEPWQCPGCDEWKAPHVDACSCSKTENS